MEKREKSQSERKTRRLLPLFSFWGHNIQPCGQTCNIEPEQSDRLRATRMKLLNPEMADIVDKFILNKVSRGTAKMITSGSQRRERVEICWLSEHPWCGRDALDTLKGGALRLKWVMRWISRSFFFDEFKPGKGRGRGEENHGRNPVVGE